MDDNLETKISDYTKSQENAFSDITKVSAKTVFSLYLNAYVELKLLNDDTSGFLDDDYSGYVTGYNYDDPSTITALLNNSNVLTTEQEVKNEIKTIKDESDFSKFSYAYADDTGYCAKLASYAATSHSDGQQVKCAQRWDITDTSRDFLLFKHVENWMDQRGISLEPDSTTKYWTNKMI